MFFGLWALLSPVLAGGGPLSGCVPACPANVLQIGSAPEVVRWAGTAETYLGLAVTVGVVVVYSRRLSAASRPQRRALLAVAATSLLFLPVFFVYHLARQAVGVDPARLETLAWALVGCRILLPLGFLVALFQAELFAAHALRQFMERLVRRPTPEQWRDSVATALDDPRLAIGYWDPASGRYREADGVALAEPAAGSGQVGCRPRAMRSRPRPWSSTRRSPRTRSSSAPPRRPRCWPSRTARSRARCRRPARASPRPARPSGGASSVTCTTARSSAWWRSRIHLGLAGEQLAGSEGGALVSRLGLEVDEALSEVRSIARGVPPVLAEHGLAIALRSASRWTAVPVCIVDGGVGRYPAAVESTVYFCCLEALQNVAKHGGPHVQATIVFGEADAALSFTIQDDGAGFDVDAVDRGAGLSNLLERVRAIGGTIAIESAPGRGTRVAGRVPVARAPRRPSRRARRRRSRERGTARAPAPAEAGAGAPGDAAANAPCARPSSWPPSGASGAARRAPSCAAPPPPSASS